MTEQLITFETAKLAKEKGLCCSNGTSYVSAFYSEDGIVFEETEFQQKDCVIEDRYFRPTQSLLQKWLREVHKIHVRIDVQDTDWYFGLDSISSEFEYKSQCEPSFKSHEEALEEGLLEALKLL